MQKATVEKKKHTAVAYKPIKSVGKGVAFKKALAGSVTKNREALKELATH